ncbi:MAG: phosphatidate cytidylyltransferase [Frankiales bacterium]|jgi:phosphatidate cytidylyltransferase|nr:phosphatidate cytidylyltransferase [Frankiales bacterium]
MARRNRDAGAELAPPAETEPSGRHGAVAGGVSVADLIARSRAQPSAPSRPAPTAPTNGSSRGHRRAEPESHSSVAVEVAPVRRALAAVDAPVALQPRPDDGDALAAGNAVPPAGKSRAGRNLPAAIAVGVGLGAVVLATLFAYRPSFMYILGLAAVLGIYEMVTAMSTVESRPPLAPLLVGGVAMDAAAWYRGPDGLVGALLLTVLGVIIWRLADGASGYLPDVASACLIALYVPFLAGFAALLLHPSDGTARIALFILAVVCSDTGGYVAGVLFGRHPMAPMVSPKKSWEGFTGSLTASAACGVLLMIFCFHEQWWKGLLFGLALAVTATLGDLGESMIKRDLGLKDMGRLLPGHGGIMDRLDSLLPCAAVAYLLLAAFLPG